MTHPQHRGRFEVSQRARWRYGVGDSSSEERGP
jgi:hypothetical protein